MNPEVFFLLAIENIIKEKYKEFSIPNLYRELQNNEKNESPISRAVLYNCWNSKRASKSTLDIIAERFGLGSYDRFIKSYEPIITARNELIGTWNSIRFTESRLIALHKWDFKEHMTYNKFYVTKTSDRNVLEGIFEIDKNGLLSGLLTDGVSSLFYSAFLVSNKGLNRILFSLNFKKNSDSYLTQEILFRNQLEIEPRIIKGQIKYKPDNEYMPSNELYLNVDKLIKSTGHTRTKISQLHTNYDHSIFISCPVRSIEDKNNFNALKNKIRDLKNLLVSKMKFDEENIHCEILDASYKPDNVFGSRVFRESKDNINKTHFIAVIPEFIENRNSGIYMEIFYRVLRRQPCFIFYEKSDHFPSLLKGYMDEKESNVAFIKVELENLISSIQDNKDQIFDFYFK